MIKPGSFWATRLLWMLSLVWLAIGQPTGFAQEESPEWSREYRQEIVVFGKDFHLGANEVSRDTIVVIGGNAIIEGTAREDVIVIGGTARVSGKVDGELVVVMGTASLESQGRIKGDATVVGGRLDLGKGAALGGTLQEYDQLPNLRWMADWVFQGALLFRPISPRVPWVWAIVGFFAILYLFLAVLFPGPGRACVAAIQETPAGSLFAGILFMLLLGPLLFLLIVSVVGILIVPVLIALFVGAVLFGKMAVYAATGAQFGRQLNLPALQMPVPGLVFGLAIFIIVYLVPVLGLIAWAATMVWGLGAVLVAVFAVFRREEVTASPVSGIRPAVTAGAASGVDGSSVSSTAENRPSASPPTVALEIDPITAERAGVWRRLAATVLDFILVMILLTVTRRVFPSSGQLLLLFWLTYHIVMWSWKGTTIGGIVLGLKLIRTDGQPLGYPVAIVRGLSSIFSALPLCLGFLWVAWDKDRQSWHDKIAGTTIIKVPRGASLL